MDETDDEQFSQEIGVCDSSLRSNAETVEETGKGFKMVDEFFFSPSPLPLIFLKFLLLLTSLSILENFGRFQRNKKRPYLE